MKLIAKICITLLAGLVLSMPVAAQFVLANSIEAINVVRQGNEIAVKIDLREPLVAPPAGFSVAAPAKVAFDFPSTANKLGKNSQVVNEGDLTSLNVVQVGERTRVVMNLLKPQSYSTRLEGKSVYVTLSPIGRLRDGAVHESARFSEESFIGVKHSLRDINFRRGKDGEARIIVELSDAGTGIDIRQQGDSLLVDFMKTSVPESLRKKLDVEDFSTPVSHVETKTIGEHARMVISPKGLWEHNAYQSDNQFVVEIKRIVEDPNKLVQGTKLGYQGPRISINYQNGDVRALLRLMAEELGLNAVISESVTGSTTLVLKDVPADQVIDIIFQQKGLDMRKRSNIIMIAPRDEIATREKLEFESRQQISELEPLRMEQFVLNYQKAVDVARLLVGAPVVGGVPGSAGAAAQPQRILSKRGNAVAEPQSNILFVNDISSKLDEIRGLIRAIDIGARQVLIEARVVEANDTFNRSLGVKLAFLNRQAQQIGNSGIGVGGGSYTPPVATSTSYTAGTQSSPNTLGVNLPIGNPAGTLAFSIFNSSLTRILNLELSALESDGIGKIISSPRVITANNVKAKIEDGTEVPYVTTSVGTGGTTQNVAFKSAKLSLEVTPQVTPEGTVRMQLVVKKEEPDWARNVQGNPPLKSSVVETNVLVDNGGTVVIGGVFVTKSENGISKVPFLGDLPVLGWLFKSKIDTQDRRELLVFITPRVLSDKVRLN